MHELKHSMTGIIKVEMPDFSAGRVFR